MAIRKHSLRVEALTYSDSSLDSVVDNHFRGQPVHRAEDTGSYDVPRIVEAFQNQLVRSRQEYLQSPSGLTMQLEWASVCIRPEEDVFVIIMSKGNAALRGRTGEDEYKVTVTAVTPAKAAAVLSRFRRDFLKQSGSQGPSFFIVSTGRRAQQAPLEEKHFLEPRRLALHYGEDFPAWTSEFLQNLGEPGISILRGETGTGKTSFLRHAMYSLSKTHRFYFVPVDNFGLLSSGSLTEFWKAEQRDHPAASKVLVLEDAEALLMGREQDKRSPVAALLNLTDGLLTQYIKLHLVCTLNCKMEDLDPALLRPGRLRFFRNFERIPRKRAEALAREYGIVLPDGIDFTLAEVFAPGKFSRNTEGIAKAKPAVSSQSESQCI